MVAIKLTTLIIHSNISFRTSALSGSTLESKGMHVHFRKNAKKGKKCLKRARKGKIFEKFWEKCKCILSLFTVLNEWRQFKQQKSPLRFNVFL